MNYDILVQIAQYLRPDPLWSESYSEPVQRDSSLAYRTLHSLSLTSKSCSSAAAKILYQDIVIRPRNGFTLKGLKRGAIDDLVSNLYDVVIISAKLIV